jgi:hypothetical protein
MKKITLTQVQMRELVEEALTRLARDPGAAHLWSWSPRPGCDDEPPGPSRRNHLTTLLKLMGAAAVPGAVAACGCGDDPCAVRDLTTDTRPDSTDPAADSTDPATDPLPESCADDPCAVDSSTDTEHETAVDAAPEVPADTPVDHVPESCADDPCGCADDPC